jgi:hypothetical protein
MRAMHYRNLKSPAAPDDSDVDSVELAQEESRMDLDLADYE